jgi:threonine synthase
MVSTRDKYRLVCTSCKKDADEKEVHSRCAFCGGPLDAVYDYGKKPTGLIGGVPFFTPVKDIKKQISLEEGHTPLYHVEKLGKKYGLKNLFVKNEGANPTGVFKDRGTTVEITKALELGAKAVMVASSGNMAASVAAYCAKAGLPCHILVPHETPVGKLVQMLEYGAHVIKIRGEYSDCVKIVQGVAAKHGFYIAGDYVYRREGQKSIAYEICEQLEFEAPDAVIIPTGAGTHLAAVWKGFKECLLLGLIDKLPRMVAVQANGAAVIYEAYKAGKVAYRPWKKTKTVCSAVAVADPSDGNLALEAVYSSKGAVYVLEDEEALVAQKLLAGNEAIFCETSSALSIAAIPLLIKDRLVSGKDKVVCIATGNGLKDVMTPLRSFKMPVTLEADLKAVDRYLKAVDRYLKAGKKG